jgi:acetoacetate decarboxylase
MIDGSMNATSYPSAPWRLSGNAIAIVRLTPIERIAPLVPNTLRVVPILPGRTLSIFYVARYTAASTLSYHECIVAPALVRRGARVGAWISNIYVDSELSMQAGREIWGLPKQIASFDWRWEERGRVAMTHEEASFELTGAAVRGRWPLPIFGGAFGSITDLRWFGVRGSARVGKSDGKLWTRSTNLTMCDFDSLGTIYSLGLRNLKIGAPTHLR